MRELEKEVALLRKRLNSSKQGKEIDVDDVKGELNVSLNTSNNIELTISATRSKEIGPAKYEREGEEISTPKEEEGMFKKYRNNIYNIHED